MISAKIDKLISLLKPLYDKNKDYLLFHGWHHLKFVRKKALEFADSIKADQLIVGAASLTHDLNYLIKPNSEPEEGKKMRQELLVKAGFGRIEMDQIEQVVMESHTGTRGKKISLEGMALSDADSLFKILPIGPIVFSQRYITQNKIDIYKSAKKITSEQNPLLEKGIYFYTDLAKDKYLDWARHNVQLWNYILEALEDEDIRELLKDIDLLEEKK